MSTATSEFLTTAEIAAELRVSEDWVARQCAAGHIKATKIGGQRGWRIRRTDLDAFTGTTVPDPARTRPTRGRRAAK